MGKTYVCINRAIKPPPPPSPPYKVYDKVQDSKYYQWSKLLQKLSKRCSYILHNGPFLNDLLPNPMKIREEYHMWMPMFTAGKQSSKGEKDDVSYRSQTR